MEANAGLLRTQATKIRSSPQFGRSALLHRLFDYLVDRSLQGVAPRETDIAVDVFGRGAEFDASQDAAIRVYMHRLRGRLDAFYAGPGSSERLRVVLPRGEYRLGLEQVGHAAPIAPEADHAAPPAPATRATPPRVRAWPWRATLGTALALSLLGNGVGAWSAWSTTHDARGGAAHTHAGSPGWSGLLSDQRPVLLVLGDYYLFGEADATPGQVPEADAVHRLVRDFGIDSPTDLHALLDRRPELAERYLNLDLGYLPTSSAFALRELLPVLAAQGREVKVVMASELRLDMLKHAHVVYVGFLSGLGVLRDFTFAGSRYAIGRGYDELVDQDSGRSFHSGAGGALGGDAMYSDFGYIAAFDGPNHTRVLIVAGTRDLALMHAAEVLASRPALDELEAALAGVGDFEALYEVNGIHHANIRGHLLQASARTVQDVWRPQAPSVAHPAR